MAGGKKCTQLCSARSSLAHLQGKQPTLKLLHSSSELQMEKRLPVRDAGVEGRQLGLRVRFLEMVFVGDESSDPQNKIQTPRAGRAGPTCTSEVWSTGKVHPHSRCGWLPDLLLLSPGGLVPLHTLSLSPFVYLLVLSTLRHRCLFLGVAAPPIFLSLVRSPHRSPDLCISIRNLGHQPLRPERQLLGNTIEIFL